jgi:hypothetical protein
VEGEGKAKVDSYSVGLVIINDSQLAPIPQSEADRYALRLRFFLILTSRRDLFPKNTLEKKLGQFRMTTASSEAGRFLLIGGVFIHKLWI